MKCAICLAMAVAVCMAVATTGWAADPVATVKDHTLRASTLNGLDVRNTEGEELGSIHDLVIDVRNGKVAYAAMSVGGLLGIGDKLFAVPFSHMKFHFDADADEYYFVVDISMEKLKAAPGFDQDHWPDFADPNWKDRIDKYYRAETTTTGAER
jgi:sporulation protein YlmC with PRC-barrel domain